MKKLTLAQFKKQTYCRPSDLEGCSYMAILNYIRGNANACLSQGFITKGTYDKACNYAMRLADRGTY